MKTFFVKLVNHLKMTIIASVERIHKSARSLSIACFVLLTISLNAQTTIPAPVLLTPANGVTNQPSTVTLKWRSVPAANSYSVAVGSTGHYNDIVWDSMRTDTSRTVTGLANGTYTWTIVAKQASPKAFGQSAVWTFTVGNTPPPPPPPPSGGLTAPIVSGPSNGSAFQILGTALNWLPVTNATFYKVIVATDPAMTNIIFTDANVTATTRITQNLSYVSTYYWTVQAANASSTGPVSNVNSFTTMPDNPNAVTTHPRLLLTQADLPRLRSWATASNPTFVSLQTALSYAVGVYNNKFFPGGIVSQFLIEADGCCAGMHDQDLIPAVAGNVFGKYHKGASDALPL